MRGILGILLVTALLSVPFNHPIPNEREEASFGPILTPPNPEVYGSSPVPEFKEYPRTRGTRSVGTEEIIVILVEFADISHQSSNSQMKFQTLMFSASPGESSMHNYYDEASYGQLNVVGNSSAWYAVSNQMSEYGADSFSGVDNANGPVYRLVTDAVMLADADIDFSEYDNDGDGMVDHLAVVHAGQGQESSINTDTIWSHRWAVLDADTSSPGNQELVVDGVQVYWYTMQSEFSPMGVFAHEFGHDLGLIDLYDTEDDSEGIGSWGLMGQGAWLGTPAGSEPAHPCAWAKVELGWIVPFEVLTPLEAESIPQVETSPVVYKLPIADTPAGEEYFLVENRQRVGFDSALPGSGLLIWHVDESVDSNDDQFHRRVDLEEADEDMGENPTQATDPWSDSAEGFTPTSVPDSSTYASVRSGWKVRNISPSGALMVADITREVEDDLAVTAVNLKMVAEVGETLTIRATIQNKGTNNRTDFNVTLTVYDDVYEPQSDIYNETITVPSLLSRASTNLTWTYVPTGTGKLLFEALVDPEGDEIPENNDRIVHSTVSSVHFFDDIESGNASWETNSAGEVYRWEIVDDERTGGGSHSPTHSWKFGYFGDGSGTLPTEAMYLQTLNTSIPGGGAAHLCFFHKYSLGELQERAGFMVRKTDRGYIMISVDGGPWQTLDTFEFSQDSWELSYYDISSRISPTGSDVRVRFEINVNVMPKSGGWWIDDVALLATPPEEGLVLKIYENVDSVNPGGLAGFVLKITNVGDRTDRFQFGIDVLISGWSAYLSQNASTVRPVADFNMSLGRDEESVFFLTVRTTEDTPRGTEHSATLTAWSELDTSKQDTASFTTVIMEDPLFELLMKALTYGVVFLIVLAVVALTVNILRQRKYKPKYPNY